MKYAIAVIPDVMLLLALLRMTYLGLHAERFAMFFFLCAWLNFCVFSLFACQVFEIISKEYAALFLISSGLAWLCGTGELIRAAGNAAKSWTNLLTILAVLVIAILASRLAVMNCFLHPLAKYLAVNYWTAVFFGTVFLLASAGSDRPDLILWRCAGAFFLIFGFGHLAIGALELGAWSYTAATLVGSVAWFALLFFLDPNRDAVFNMEKLGITMAGLRLFLLPLTKPTARNSRG